MVDLTRRTDDSSTNDRSDTLREERQRTGKYVATVIAIFVCSFGMYQALSRGTPEYAAFFLPALIMFGYVMWILYASKSKRHGRTSSSSEEEEDDQIEIEVRETRDDPVKTHDVPLKTHRDVLVKTHNIPVETHNSPVQAQNDNEQIDIKSDRKSKNTTKVYRTYSVA